MRAGRVLAVYLDGFDEGLGARLIGEGKLPAIAALRRESARFLLQHGVAERSGLAGEHFGTGLPPEATGRWSDVHFDAHTYKAWQTCLSTPTFVAGSGISTVVFDATHFSLADTQEARGVVNWGSQGPSVPFVAKPSHLKDEVIEKFGPYPAQPWLFGFAWPSPDRCRAMGGGLARAVRTRGQIATWLLGERLPDWYLGIVVSGELHSASEAFWFGVDESHPLHGRTPSASAAAQALEEAYMAVDGMVAELRTAFSDATMVLFALGGMGLNVSDLPSMVLLPELMFRRSFGRPLFNPRPDWQDSDCPSLGEDEQWVPAVNRLLPANGTKMKSHKRSGASRSEEEMRDRISLKWMPATRYRAYWRNMDAFALPSFRDGRVRINLQGRERDGQVHLQDYEEKQREIEDYVRSCIDPRTGCSVVSYVERLPREQALAAPPTSCDLMIGWCGTAQAFDHPELGRIGPLPFNRTGGHTGPYGFAYLNGPALRPGDYGTRSSFDVVPTIFDLLGRDVPERISGLSLLQQG